MDPATLAQFNLPILFGPGIGFGRKNHHGDTMQAKPMRVAIYTCVSADDCEPTRGAEGLLQDLIEVLQTIRQTGVGLYIHTQSLDTTAPSGHAMFGMLGVFAEFEREMIVARVNAGLARAKAAGTRLGRPTVDDETVDRLRAELAKGTGMVKAAKIVGVGTGLAQRVKREMAEGKSMLEGPQGKG
jgi:Resolvase, N terminal domain